MKQLADSHGIRLFFLETPKYEKLYADSRGGGYPELLEELEAMVYEEKVPYLPADILLFDCTDGENFQDLIHLSAKGRESYSRQLCETITSKDDIMNIAYNHAQ